MHADSCIYAEAPDSQLNMLISVTWELKIYHAGGVGEGCPTIFLESHCRLWVGGGGLGSVSAVAFPSRCHHLKEFSSGEHAKRIDLKCPLARA